MRRHTTLSGQLLALQLLIMLGVLAGVTAVSIAQSGESTRRSESRSALSAAESVAGNPLVRSRLPQAKAQGDSFLLTAAETSRTLSGSSSILLIKLDGTVITSADPSQVGARFTFANPSVPQGRSWTGLIDTPSGTVVSSQVPVFAPEDQEIVGVAVVERAYPSVLQRWGEAIPNLATYLGIAGGLGILGSLLLARRVKRQTMGLEPQEITRLVEHRESMLHGLKEGLIGLDLDQRIVLAEDRVLTLNRKPIMNRGKVIGSVTTLRDRTELDTLRRELGVVRTATDTLRAQTHEFANQLHVISGLVQLEEYDDVVRFIDNVARGRAELSEDVTGRVLDPALAALLVAKVTLATERGVTLRFAEGAGLGRIDDDLSLDLTTVVGNLVDNAIESVGGGTPGGQQGSCWVEVDLREEGEDIVVEVRDSGPGVGADIADRIFDKGFSTKLPGDDVGRGYGLALTGLVCRRRGGSVQIEGGEGAAFTARMSRQVYR